VNNIQMLITENQRIIDISADVDFNIQEKEGVPSIHVADALSAVVLARCKDKPEASLLPGKYNVRLMAVITENSDD